MIRIEALSKSWAEFWLRDIDLRIRHGEYFALLGPTGAGKTLLMELILGLHTPDKGTIKMDGRTLDRVPPEKRGMGMVFQNIFLFPHMNVHKNLLFGSKDKDLGKEAKMLRTLGITKLLHRYPYTLSRGEQQRVAIGRALLSRPKVLLLDEPFSALDRITTRRISQYIKRLNEKEGLTVIHVSHDQEEVMRVADKFAIMNNGLIEGKGTWREIFRTPGSEFIARLVGVENLIPGVATASKDGTIISINGISMVSDTQREGKVTIAIRADEIHVSRDMKTGVENQIQGSVSGVFERGTNVEIRVDISLADDEDPKEVVRAHVSRQTYSNMTLNLGDKVTLRVPKKAIMVFPRTMIG